MAKRRDSGNGALFFVEGRQRWCAEVRTRGDDGKRRSARRYFVRKAEGAEWLRTMDRERSTGLDLTARDQTLADYLTRWLDRIDPRTPAAGLRKVRHTTHGGYERRTRLYVNPALGTRRLRDLTPEHVRQLIADLSARDDLSPTTVGMIRDTLVTALNRAVKDRLIPFNPAAATDSVTRCVTRKYVLTVRRPTHSWPRPKATRSKPSSCSHSAPERVRASCSR